MDRRTLFRGAACVGVGALAAACSEPAQHTQTSVMTEDAPGTGVAHPIVLYCDLAIDPAREQEMLDAFHTRFRPAAESFRGRGFVDLKMLKVRTVIQGAPLPAGINYRFQLTYESEEQRQVWVRSDLHQEVWPLIEVTVLNTDYQVLLTDAV
jgi:heme-degrading monooxygenase HmoA